MGISHIQGFLRHGWVSGTIKVVDILAAYPTSAEYSRVSVASGGAKNFTSEPNYATICSTIFPFFFKYLRQTRDCWLPYCDVEIKHNVFVITYTGGEFLKWDSTNVL